MRPFGGNINSILDCLCSLLVVWIVITNKTIHIDATYIILLFLSIYLATRLLITIFPQIANQVLFLWILICSSYELLSGLSQLCGLNPSNHSLFSLTGSFDNPGPYGGFLATCTSMLAAYCVHKYNQKQKLISKSLYWSTSSIAIGAVIILPSTQSRSAILALGCSMILLAFGTDGIKTKIEPILKRYGIPLLLGVTTLVVGAYLFKKPSADGRLFVDKICITAMYENGRKGFGLEHFGRAYGETQASYFKKQIAEKGKDDLDWSVINEHDRITADSPDNAFNEYLFIGVEYGPLAMLLFIGVIVSAIVISFKRGTIWCYGLTAFAVFAMFSYPLHVWQFQVMLPILLAAAISDGETCKNRKKIAELVMLSITIVVLAFGAWRKIPEIKQYKHAKATWKKTERWHKKEYYEYVVEDCDTLLPYMKHDEHFLFAYGQSLNKTGNYVRSDSILQLGTIVSSDPMFWNVMGNNSLAQGKCREAEERYKHAFYMVPNRLYPLYLLAKLYHTEGDTARFLKMAERVETFIPKVESVNTERLRSEIREIRDGYLLHIKQ